MRAPFSGSELAGVLALALLAAAILAWRWVGYQGHDDASYAAAALDWVRHFPPLGTDHWALRYTLVLPIAGLIALTGPSVAALAAPDLAAYAAFLVVGYLAVRHWFGRGAAMLLTLIGVLLPEFPVQATYANPDLLEMALSLLSFWTLLRARALGGSARLMLLAGVLAGFSYLTRETTLALLILYTLMFLVRPAMPRLRYLWIALGFVVVVGAQAGILAVRTGDPLYQMRVDAHHDTVDRSAKQAAAAGAGHAVDSEGVLAVSPWVAPLAAVFVSQKYGLLFFLALPAFVILHRSAWLSPAQRSVVDWSGIGGAVAFLFVAVNARILYVVPRYFMVCAALAAVPVAVLAAHWMQGGGARRVLAVLAVLAFATTSLALLYLENTRPMLPEQRIVAFARSASSPVYVDPETARRIHYLALAAGVPERIIDAPPPAGSLVASEDGVVQTCLHDPGCTLHARMLPFVPGPGWTELARYTAPRRRIGVLLDVTGLGRAIPQDIRKKVEQPGGIAVIYRRP